MPRPIDADALKASFEEDGHLSTYIEEYIDDAPTLDYAPVRHGEWERMDEYCNHSKEFKCTACKQSVFYDHFTRFCEYEYCPNCGALMDGKEEV